MRSQVKHAQMEREQLSTLITMVQTVQEQQGGQQELSRTPKSSLEGLTLSQHEQGVRLEAKEQPGGNEGTIEDQCPTASTPSTHTYLEQGGSLKGTFGR